MSLPCCANLAPASSAVFVHNSHACVQSLSPHTNPQLHPIAAQMHAQLQANGMPNAHGGRTCCSPEANRSSRAAATASPRPPHSRSPSASADKRPHGSPRAPQALPAATAPPHPSPTVACSPPKRGIPGIAAGPAGSVGFSAELPCRTTASRGAPPPAAASVSTPPLRLPSRVVAAESHAVGALCMLSVHAGAPSARPLSCDGCKTTSGGPSGTSAWPGVTSPTGSPTQG